MNWRIETTAKQLAKAELQVDHAESETPSKAKPKAKPSAPLVAAARVAAEAVAKELGGKDIHVELHGHETTTGRGFKPGHVVISVSRLDPKRPK